ncbi:unnamed protein product [Boreogadus saida]
MATCRYNTMMQTPSEPVIIHQETVSKAGSCFCPAYSLFIPGGPVRGPAGDGPPPARSAVPLVRPPSPKEPLDICCCGLCAYRLVHPKRPPRSRNKSWAPPRRLDAHPTPQSSACSPASGPWRSTGKDVLVACWGRQMPSLQPPRGPRAPPRRRFTPPHPRRATTARAQLRATTPCFLTNHNSCRAGHLSYNPTVCPPTPSTTTQPQRVVCPHPLGATTQRRG